MLWRALALTGMASLFSAGALAQWQWVDGSGGKVFSDTPPPASVPDRSIIRRPDLRPPAEPAAGPASDAAGNATAARPVARDELLQTRKEQALAAEQSRQEAEAARVAKARAENCERARRAQATLESGLRIATTNARGEREVLGDEARAAESRRLNQIIQSDCVGAAQ